MSGNRQNAEQLRRNMVADIAHELRTPLAVIQGNLQAILDVIYPLSKDEIATIRSETVVLGRLINDLRDLAQAEAGTLDLSLQPVDMAALVEAVVGGFREQADARGLLLRIDQATDGVRVGAGAPTTLTLAYPDGVRQVVNNLVSNAVRHTLAGGTVSLNVSHIAALPGVPGAPGDPGAPRAPASVEVSVVHTGRGIAADDLPHIFNRFWRSDKSRAREHGGSGLGLTIVGRRVEAQGGRIGVESQPGKGSRFWFTLPATSAQARVKEPVKV